MLLRMTFAILLILVTVPAQAGVRTAAGLFADAQFAEARKNLQAEDMGARPGEDLLWRSRLETDPDKADALLVTALANSEIPLGTRQGLVLQLAQMRHARRRHGAALEVLVPYLNDHTSPVPGRAVLIAALSYRALGDLQRSRELLAGIKPEDPAFGNARFYLGDIGLQTGETELALRYFESGQRDGEADPRLLAGCWRALRASGQDDAAATLLNGLQKQAPSCLALVEITRVLRTEEDEDQARISSHQADEPPTVVTAPVPAGRYTLQLGAFHDRRLALDFLGHHKEAFSDLFITTVRDEQGQFMYKVRYGSFVNPARARSEAKRLEQEHGIDIIVVETEASFGDQR